MALPPETFFRSSHPYYSLSTSAPESNVRYPRKRSRDGFRVSLLVLVLAARVLMVLVTATGRYIVSTRLAVRSRIVLTIPRSPLITY